MLDKGDTILYSYEACNKIRYVRGFLTDSYDMSDISSTLNLYSFQSNMFEIKGEVMVAVFNRGVNISNHRLLLIEKKINWYA